VSILSASWDKRNSSLAAAVFDFLITVESYSVFHGIIEYLVLESPYGCTKVGYS